MEKLKLFRIYDIVCEGGYVMSAKKEFIADLKDEDEALKYPKEMEELYIIKFNEEDKAIGVHGMAFGECEDWFGEGWEMLDEPCGILPPSLDGVEHDYRVFASVAFGEDWV